jgi:hypothetical protein
VPAAAIAALIAVAVLLFLPAGEDAAAHLYQTEIWRNQGWQLWDNNWYAGRYSQINYSLVYYPLAALLSTIVVVAASVAGAVAAFSRIVHARWPSVASWPSLTFAFLAPLPVLTGTYPFLLGFALALSTLAALQAGRRKLTVGLAAVTAVAHLLAFLLLVTAAAGIVLATPRWWQRKSIRGLIVAFAIIAGVAALLLRAFRSPGGEYPFSIADLLVVLTFCAAGALLTRGRPDLRILLGVFGVYAVLAAAAFVFPSPLGGNVGRLSLYMAAPLLLVPLAVRNFRPRAIALALLGAALLWQTFPAVSGLRAATEVRSSREDFWYPVEAFLAKHGDPNYRVEVVATDHHWEAFYLARRGVPLTRGWYRQDDFPANQDLYGELTPAKYLTWLRRLGVRYVFLPNDRLDYSAEAEASLLRSGGVLPEIARIGAWTVYELPDATPIATPAGPIAIRAIDSKEVTLEASQPGNYRLRLRYTPYWRVTRGDACVARDEPWATELRVSTPGIITLRFDVGVGKVVTTVLGRSAQCLDPTTGVKLRALPTAGPDGVPRRAPRGSSPGDPGSR